MSGLDDSDLSLSSLPTVGDEAPVRKRAESGAVDELFGTLSELGFGPDSSFSSALESPEPGGPAAPARPRISSYSDLIDIPPAFFEPPPVAPQPSDDSAEFSLLLAESQGVPPTPAVRRRSESKVPVVDIPSGFFDRVEDDRAISLVPESEAAHEPPPPSAGPAPSSRHAAAAYPPTARAPEGSQRSVTSSRDERLVVPRAVAGVRRPRPDSALHRAVAERVAAGPSVRRPAVRVSNASLESVTPPADSATVARIAPVPAPASRSTAPRPDALPSATPPSATPQPAMPGPATPQSADRPPVSPPPATPERPVVARVSAASAAPGGESTEDLHFPALPPVPARRSVPATLDAAPEVPKVPRAIAPPPTVTPREQSTALAPHVSAVLNAPAPPLAGSRTPNAAGTAATRTAATRPAPRRPVPPPTGDTTQFSIPNPAAAPRPVTPSVEDVSWERIIESATSVRSSRSSSAEHVAVGASGANRRNSDR